MSKKTAAFVLVLAAGLIADQATKAWARTADVLQTGDGWAIHDALLHFVHRENPGAAFSLLEGLPDGVRVPLFLAFNAIAAVIALRLLVGLEPDRWVRGAFLGMFLSGALGNAIDRITQGTVTDFIRFHIDYEPIYGWLMAAFGRADWPVFNVADGLLLVGVVGIAVGDLVTSRRERPDAPAA